LNQKSLPHILFPLGELTKAETRGVASDLGLLVADKPESQEICFIPDNNYRRFIAEKRPQALTPGLFVDKDGNVLGRHKGFACYTIGQRKGLGIALGKPMFVFAIHPGKNEVCLGDETELFTKRLSAVSVNWIAGRPPVEPMQVQAKIRYATPAQDAMLTPVSDAQAEVCFEKPQRAITPGQSVVFYIGNEVIGGGIIES
jgi:tRNA-specific 2-thiouridylase